MELKYESHYPIYSRKQIADFLILYIIYRSCVVKKKKFQGECLKPCLFQMERSILNWRLIAPFPADLSVPGRVARLVICTSHRLPECTAGLIRSHRAEHCLSTIPTLRLPDSRTLSVYRFQGNTEWSQGRGDSQRSSGLADAELLEAGRPPGGKTVSYLIFLSKRKWKELLRVT